MPLTGLIAAPHTPFHEDGELKTDVIDLQAEHMARTGVDGVFVCGTTGEGMSLTSAERRTVAERWVKAAAGRFPVVVHVGHTSLKEARELATHAEAVGAYATAAVPPFYPAPVGIAEVVRSLSVVAAAAPRTPFYFYDIPGLTGLVVPTAEVMERLAEVAPNFAGVKYSNPDLVTLQECLRVRGVKFDVLFGIDEILLAAFSFGVRGAVGSTYNFAAPLYRRLMAAFQAGDIATARALQHTAVLVVRAIERHGGLAANKAVMRLIGIDCGPVRPPLRPVSDDDLSALDADLTRLGFFSYETFAPPSG